MKKIKFTCPHCEAKLRVPSHLAGVTAPCPKCGASITAPSDVAAAVYESPAPRRQVSAPEATPASRPRPEPTLLAAAPEPSGGTAVLAPPVSAPVSERPAAPARTAAPRPAAAAPLPAPAVLPTPEPPAPSVSGPASSFFTTPPPPSRPFPAPEEVLDERSEPPAAIADDSEVIVEEEILVDTPPPPPVSQITQPIRVSAAPGDLPLARGQGEAGSLPRLDISLAKPVPSGSIPHAETVAPVPRTRVVLPQPGTVVAASVPEDFLAPAHPAATPAPPMHGPSAAEVPPPFVPEEPVEAPRWDEALPSFEDFAGLAETEVPETEVRYTTIPLPVEGAPIPLDDLEFGMEEAAAGGDADFVVSGGETAALPAGPPALPDPFTEPEPEPLAPTEAVWPETKTTSVPLHVPLSAPVPRGEADPAFPPQFPPNALHEGSFGRLFAQQAPPEDGPPHSQVPALPGQARQIPAGPFPVEPAPMEPIVAEPVPVEPALPAAPGRSDELDELFGGAPGGGRTSKRINRTVILWLSSAAVVAILASLGFVYVANTFLGGFTPAEGDPEEETAEAAPAGPVVRPKIPESAAPAPAAPPLPGDAPAIEDPVALIRENSGNGSDPTTPGAATESPALSFDEKVQQAVNGSRGGSVIGSPGLDLIEDPVTSFIPPSLPIEPNPPAPPSGAAETEGGGLSPSAVEAAGNPEVPPVAATLAGGTAPVAAKDPNYRPPDFFPAPGPGDSTLGRTRDLIDAFLRAPDWETRAKYSYHGESLRAAMEDYHKKWPFQRFDRFSVSFYQMESDPSLGGPYWVFLVSKSDEDDGFPVIVRVEEGNLKLDWEIFAEFADRHFTRFREGATDPPATFRLILERFSDYYGSDREAFTELGDHLVYQVIPPYGNENEFAEFVFVKKGTPVAQKLDSLIKLGDAPLAVIVTLDQQAFAHGVKHYVVSNLVSEGWFR